MHVHGVRRDTHNIFIQFEDGMPDHDVQQSDCREQNWRIWVGWSECLRALTGLGNHILHTDGMCMHFPKSRQGQRLLLRQVLIRERLAHISHSCERKMIY